MFDLGIIQVRNIERATKGPKMCQVMIEMPYRSLEPHMYRIYLTKIGDDTWNIFEIRVENFFE